MKKMILLILVGLFSATMALGQQSESTMKFLESTVWTSTPNENQTLGKENAITDGHYTVFNNSKRTYLIVRENAKIKSYNIMPFYLSDTPDKNFHPDKVGNYDNGKYLIYLIEDPNAFLMDALMAEVNKDYTKLNARREVTLQDVKTKNSSEFILFCYEIVEINPEILRLKQVRPELANTDIIIEYYSMPSVKIE